MQSFLIQPMSNKFLALACAAAGVIGLSAVNAQAAQPDQAVNALPAVAHINQVVVVERHHHHHYYHHRRYYYRHHRRYYY